MSGSRLNALILMYVYRKTKFDRDKIIEFFANMHSRRMLLILPEKTK